MFRSRLFIILIVVVSQGINAMAQENFDSPDTELESKMFDINQKFNSQPVPESDWLNVLGARRSEAYKIQTGDTLWDISQTFFGDGHFWPKLWSENGAIQNPHQILPRRSIVFLAGTVADAPVFNVVRNEDVVLDAPTYVAPDVQDEDLIDPEEPRVINGKPVIPKPTKASAPVLETLPSSFETAEPPSYGDYDSSGLDVSALKERNVAQAAQLIPFIVLQDIPNGVGKVAEMESGFEFAGTSQIILVKMEQGAEPGQEFTTYFHSGKLKNEEISKGRIIEVGGRIKIKEVVSEQENIYRATVTEAVNPVRIGSIVTTLPLPTVNFDMDRAVSPTVATVVGGEFDRVRRVVGLGSVVYLKSSSQALTDGEILTVESIRKNRVAGTSYPAARRPVAIVKVANVDGDLATAVIINSLEEVTLGDITGGPAPKVDSALARPTRIQEIKNSSVN